MARSSAIAASGRPAPRYGYVTIVLVSTERTVACTCGVAYGPVAIKAVCIGSPAPRWG